MMQSVDINSIDQSTAPSEQATGRAANQVSQMLNQSMIKVFRTAQAKANEKQAASPVKQDSQHPLQSTI